MNKDKSPKEEKSLFSSDIQPKTNFEQKKNGNICKSRISLLFFKAILLFIISINISMKYKVFKTKDIIFSFEYNDRTNDT